MDKNIRLLKFDKDTGLAEFAEYVECPNILVRTVEINLYDIQDKGVGYECMNFKMHVSGVCEYNGVRYDCLDDMLDGISSSEKVEAYDKDVNTLLTSIEMMVTEDRMNGVSRYLTSYDTYIYKLVDKENNRATVFIPRETYSTRLKYQSSVWINDDNKYDTIEIIGGGFGLVELISLFNSAKASKIIMDKFVYKNVQCVDNMYSYASIDELDLSWTCGCNITSAVSMFHMYRGAYIDLNQFNGKDITNINYMFMDAKTELLGSFDTSKVEQLVDTFKGFFCEGKLDLNWMNVSNVTTMSGTFKRCVVKTIDITTWDTRKVKDATGMFIYSRANVIGIDKVNFESLEAANGMFSGVVWKRKIALDNIKWANIKDAGSMFANAEINKLDLTTFGAIDDSNAKINSRSSLIRETQGMFSGFKGKVMVKMTGFSKALLGTVISATEFNARMDYEVAD